MAESKTKRYRRSGDTSDEASHVHPEAQRINPHASVGYPDSVFPCARGNLRPHLLGEALTKEDVLILFC